MEGVARHMVFLVFLIPYPSSKIRPFRILIQAVEVNNEYALPAKHSHVLNSQFLGIFGDLLYAALDISCQRYLMAPLCAD